MNFLTSSQVILVLLVQESPFEDRWCREVGIERDARPWNQLKLNEMNRRKINMSWRRVNRHEDEARGFQQVGLGISSYVQAQGERR